MTVPFTRHIVAARPNPQLSGSVRRMECLPNLSTAVASAGAVLVVVSVVVALGAQQRSGSTPSIVGVWKLSEMTYTGPNARKVTSPQPGLAIFTRQHYSITVVESDKPRAELPAKDATDKQLAEAFDPFIANGGTYEIKGTEITYRSIVAKDPAGMRAGNFFVATFKLEGNTLWITGKSNASGPVANPLTVKYTRLE